MFAYRRSVRSTLILVTLLLVSHSLWAASFNCEKAATTNERLICSNPQLSKLDEELAEIYKEAVRKAPSIRQDQRDWIRQMAQCRDAACLIKGYEQRKDDLITIIVRSDRDAMRAEQEGRAPAAQAPSPPQAPAQAPQPQAGSGSGEITDAMQTAYQNGVCVGALVVSGKKGDEATVNRYMPRHQPIIRQHAARIEQTCGSTGLNEACWTRLPGETRAFIQGQNEAQKELRSPAKMNLYKKPISGTDPMAVGLIVLAYCN